MKRSHFLFLAVAILFGVIGAYFGVKKHAPAAPEQDAVRHFLAQTMPAASGKSESLGQWAGKPLVVNFWATWCAPCVEEMPALTALQSELKTGPVQIIGIGIDSPSNISEFSVKHNIGYPLYVAGLTGTDLSRRFGNQAGGLPFTVLIGSDGSIKKRYTGRLDMKELRKDIAGLLSP
jgi:thiol-disulfide isomerase/thioredoxin